MTALVLIAAAAIAALLIGAFRQVCRSWRKRQAQDRAIRELDLAMAQRRVDRPPHKRPDRYDHPLEVIGGARRGPGR